MLITQDHDTLRSEFDVTAPIERVWAALTTKAGWEAWFSEGVSSDFQVGSEIVMDFGSDGVVTGVVVERIELVSFAYRWHPGATVADSIYLDEEMTTVRFELSATSNGTRVTLV